MPAKSDTVEAVRARFDRQPFGNGAHLVLLFSPGQTHITVFSPATLRHERIRRDALPPAEPIALTPWRWRRLAVQIDDRRKLFKRNRKRHNPGLVRRIVEACRARADAGRAVS